MVALKYKIGPNLDATYLHKRYQINSYIMDYKKAIGSSISITNVQTDLNEIITTHNYDEIQSHISKLVDEVKECSDSNLTDSSIINMLNDNETSLYHLLEDLRSRFYFQGLLCDLKTTDVFDIIMKACSFELCDDDIYATHSDEEIQLP